MGLRTFLIFPGLIVLIAFIIVEISAPPGGGTGNTISFLGSGQQNGPPPVTYICTSQIVACFSSGSLPPNSRVTCQSNAAGTLNASCDLWDNCNNVPNGAYCVTAFFFINLRTAIDDGVSLYVAPSGQVTQATNIPTSQFAYGALSSQSLLIMVTVAVGVAALAGIAVFGSGENAESVHILFVAGLLLALWAVFSALEGFITGSPSSGFTQLNLATGLPLGTGLYLILTLLYVVGVTGTVSRGL